MNLLKLASLVPVLLLAQPQLVFAHDAAARIQAPAGTYVLEKTHASLTWRVRHMGMSNYTARFKSFDVTLQFDPKNLSRSSVQATVDVGSIETDFVPSDGRDFNAELRGAPFFNVGLHPQATFTSRQVVSVSTRRMRVTGDFTLLGITKPVTLEVTLNGSMKSHPFAKVPALGFSARGIVPRLAFGLNPPPVQEGVGTDVEVLIEAEFIQKH